MRVLHVIKGLGAGGAERLLVSLARARSADVSFDVAYVLPKKDALVDELVAAGAGVHLIGGARGLADPRWVVRLAQLTGRLRPDVVHLHSPAVAAVARLLLRARRHRPVIVSTEHNTWGAFGPVTRAANALTLPLGDASLAVSEEVKGSAGRRAADMEVVVQGVPVVDLRGRRHERAQARERLGAGPDDVVVVMVANFREKKDYPTYLRAASECATDPRLRFVSIGQGPLEGEVHELSRQLGLGDRLCFRGFEADAPSVVVGGDIFTLTSRYEGLPISLLEAMALGLAPVVSAAGGIPHVITDGVDGLLVPPGDVSGFAAAYRQLADDEEHRRQLAEAAARRVDDFDIGRTQDALEARYRQLLGDRT